MDIDFHFGTIYVLSRWAGFNEENSKIIATSSQFVDDNMDENPIKKLIYTKDAAKYDNDDDIIKRYSGHARWQDLSDEGNKHVWVPYHFLPSLEGNTEEEKLICKKNSTTANELALLISDSTLENNNLFKLGIGLHVYADTWAHQEFSGITDRDNNIIHNIEVIVPEMDELEKNEDGTLSEVLDKVKPLGHGSAVHFPDRPYIKWKSDEKFSEGRANWDEFMEAAQQIYNVLLKYNKGKAEIFSVYQRDVLLDRFKSTMNEDCEQRNEDWMKYVKNPDNYFGITELSDNDKKISYDKNLILDNKDNRINFYKALDEHYNWVKDKLRKAQVSILED
ncbi:DUF6765 family protein [Pectinatus frisingensis]|uniref:DUF6765 family protein n=1 Tax=Pectinatus frisingensis TaxID=865 RepID=UPI0018C52A33|nr:DUF6765 family protein [Pectinatus frisingensis]